MFYGPMGWDGQWDTHASAIRTCGHPLECPMVPWDSGMGSGIHKHLREGQLDVPWNVPWYHGMG